MPPLRGSQEKEAARGGADGADAAPAGHAPGPAAGSCPPAPPQTSSTCETGARVSAPASAGAGRAQQWTGATRGSRRRGAHSSGSLLRVSFGPSSLLLPPMAARTTGLRRVAVRVCERGRGAASEAAPARGAAANIMAARRGGEAGGCPECADTRSIRGFRTRKPRGRPSTCRPPRSRHVLRCCLLNLCVLLSPQAVDVG